MACAVLIFATIAMLLISIHPFALRKICLLALALLGLSSAICLADPLFMTKQHASSDTKVRLARPQTALQTNRNGALLNRTSSDRSLFPVEDGYTTAARGNNESLVPTATQPSSLSTVRLCWLADVADFAREDTSVAPGSGF